MNRILLLVSLSFLAFFVLFNGLHQPKHNAPVQRAEKDSHEEDTDEPLKFFQFHQGIRTRDGESQPGYTTSYKWHELKLARQSNALRRRSGLARGKSNGVIAWKERGPGNVPGRTRALLNISTDVTHNTWLAGSATGGIWRTTNGGSTWSERSSNFPALPISSFAADENIAVIYAGTGEFVSTVYSAIGNGIFRSTDQGETWTQIPATNNNTDFAVVTRLIVHPSDPDIIVATTAPHSQSNNNTSAIMRSIDGGTTWQKAEEVNGVFEQIVATPGNFNVQYASQNGVGVWKSIDGGVTWNLSNTGMEPDGRVEISISPVNTNKVFASAVGSLTGTGADLYVSSNAGASWEVVDVKFNNTAFDFFEGQGFYDNTILCDPFNENNVYVGGVSLFRVTTTNGTSSVDNFNLVPSGTEGFLLLQSFTGINFDQQRLDVTGPPYEKIDVEVRFGPGDTQKAHRFLVPVDKTNGVTANEYTYSGYVDVPFEVWDVTNNRQLMVSFRDQNRNGTFDLIPSYLTANGVDYLANSREYLYIHNIIYSTSSNSSISQTGGHEASLIFTIFPALSEGGTWDEANLPDSKLTIDYNPLTKVNSTTVVVADGRGSFDNKNPSDQVILSNGVHPDHHCLIPIITNQATKNFKLLLGNDGGIFVSKASSEPGITNGDWQFKGLGYNTSQFYGADKKPLSEEYIGGMQDNGTRISPAGESAHMQSVYTYAIGGDGFEVLWNSKNRDQVLGSIYYGDIFKSINAGGTWQRSTSGFTPSDNEFPFITKLANSKDFPDRVFTVGSSGVYVSENFGASWKLTEISSQFVNSNAFFVDVEVSRANANIVWAGSGMNNTPGNERKLHVSSDGGKTFQATNNFTAVTLGNITKLASHPTEANTAYAIFSFSDAPKILRTTNLGQTWQDISGFGTGSSSTNGFPDVAVYCLYVRSDNPQILWAGTEIGIVESQDNGVTWSMLEDFPNVAVWDMKGQDNEIVIATHGRGIWTATLSEPQTGSDTPVIVASGTSPQQQLALRIKSLKAYDSLDVFISGKLLRRIQNVIPQTFDLYFDGVTAGVNEIKLVTYTGGIPHQSMTEKINHLSLLSQNDSYATYFTSITDLTVEEMTLQNLAGANTQPRKTLQTAHNYPDNKIHQILIRTPVTVSDSYPIMHYRDIAIIEPEHDSVVIEATLNGLDWIPLRESYDASLNDQWTSAFQNQQPGLNTMFVDHEINLLEKFKAGNLLLFRLRLISNANITGWGWAVDYITIQEKPEIPALEPLSIFPNPSPTGLTNIQYILLQPSDVTIQVFDVYGRKVGAYLFTGRSTGTHTETIQFENKPNGHYIVVVDSKDGRRAGKLKLTR